MQLQRSAVVIYSYRRLKCGSAARSRHYDKHPGPIGVLQWEELGGVPSSAWACLGAERHGHIGVPPRPCHPGFLQPN